tara:strand:+ start:24 stop:374 length:351 start_codon:yes stop_codon:yes gene_type:complete
MRLYTTPTGKWAGTQSDAKKLGDFCEAEVPTIKADLLAFLNEHQVVFGIYTALGYETPSAPVAEPSAPSEPRNLKGGSWDEYNAIRDHLETCDAKALNTALTIITGRLGDLLEDAN